MNIDNICMTFLVAVVVASIVAIVWFPPGDPQ